MKRTLQEIYELGLPRCCQMCRFAIPYSNLVMWTWFFDTVFTMNQPMESLAELVFFFREIYDRHNDPKQENDHKTSVRRQGWDTEYPLAGLPISLVHGGYSLWPRRRSRDTALYYSQSRDGIWRCGSRPSLFYDNPEYKRHPNYTKTDQLLISEVITGLPRPYHHNSQ